MSSKNCKASVKASSLKIKERAFVPHLSEIARPDDMSVSPRRFSFTMEGLDLNNLNLV